MDLDWGLLETFLHVAEAGSSSAAAARLGVSQPTVSRRVQALEQALGVTLFVRHARGLALTERGQQLLAHASELGRQVDEVVRKASGMRQVPRGEVRVSVNEPLGVYVLLPALPRLYARYPEIEVELHIDNRRADLSRREADIAVRMFEPRAAELIAKRLGEVQLGLFASPEYVDRHGMPRSLAERDGHVLVGGDQDPDWHRALATLGLSPHDFVLRTDSLTAQIEAVRSGLAIGGTHVGIAARFGLLRVFRELPLPPLPVWLVSHAELRTSAAVRTVFDFLADELRAYLHEGREGVLARPRDR